MIKNERQYKITKSYLDKFKETLLNLEKKDVTSLIELEKNAIQSQITDLKREIDEYNDLKSGMVPVFELNSIDQLPKTLIKARISLGLSQKKLGELIGLHEQQIQRYESTDYETASIAKIKEIAKALNLEIEKNIPLPTKNFTKTQFFKKVEEMGLDREFVVKRLLPASLSARFEDPDVSPELLGYQAASHIGRIFDVNPAQIFSHEPLVLNTSPLSQVRFKLPKNVNSTKLNAYTVYARYISLLVSQATKHISPKKIPDDPFVVRNEILEKYGEINFETLLHYVWSLGIPVLTLDPISFHAACFRDEGRSIIVLTQKTSSEARWMFNLLHEFYHASQGTEQIAEQEDELHDTEEERIASKFADIVLLGQDPHELATLCLDRSDWNIPVLKNQVKKIATEYNVRADVLANYLAFRLSSEQNENWWGTAEYFQKPLPIARNITQNILRENIDFNALTETDLGLLKQVVDIEEVPVNA